MTKSVLSLAAASTLLLGANLSAPPPVQPPRPTTPPPAVPGQPDVPTTHTVRLLQAGEDPEELRIKVTADLAQRTESTAVMTMTMMGRTMQGPPMLVTTETSAVSVDEDTGDITYQFEITDATLGDTTNADPMMTAQMHQNAAAMAGTKGQITMTSQGLPKEVPDTGEPEIPGFDPNALAMGIPLPEEPIGVGGSWEVTTQMQQRAFTVEQVAVYTIESIDGDIINVSATVNQSVDARSFTDQGMTMTLKQFTFEGTGSGSFRLDRIVPERLEVKQTTTIVVAVESGPLAGQELTRKNESMMSLKSEVIKDADGG